MRHIVNHYKRSKSAHNSCHNIQNLAAKVKPTVEKMARGVARLGLFQNQSRKSHDSTPNQKPRSRKSRDLAES